MNEIGGRNNICIIVLLTCSYITASKICFTLYNIMNSYNHLHVNKCSYLWY